MKQLLTSHFRIALAIAVLFVFNVPSQSKTHELPDSTQKVIKTFNYAIDANEKNNAIFPVLIQSGFENEYHALKDTILSLIINDGISADEAVGRYFYWFFKYFDRHVRCSSDYFGQQMLKDLVNYEEIFSKYDPQPVGCAIDDETYLLRLPSCQGDSPTMEWLLEKKEEFQQSGCKDLILDLRGNSGGSDEYSLLFTELMCDSSAREDEIVMYMNSEENNKMLKKMYDSNPDTTIQRVLNDAASAAPGSLINWISNLKGEDSYVPKVRQGAIIIDNFCASAGESAIRMVRNHSRHHAKVYGRESTMGADKSGNCNEIQLPDSSFTFMYPTCVDMALKNTSKTKKPGHAPDVIIPLPYPQQLTDNIDEWVLWVAKKMKDTF